MKEEEAEVIRVLNQSKDSAELRAVVKFANIKKATTLEHWKKATGLDELVKHQQQYLAWEVVIKTIKVTSPVFDEVTETGEGE